MNRISVRNHSALFFSDVLGGARLAFAWNSSLEDVRGDQVD